MTREHKAKANQDREAGYVAGMTWADSCAKDTWLKRLAEKRTSEIDAAHPLLILHLAIDPSGQMNEAEIYATCFGEKRNASKAYVAGFIDGAVAQATWSS